MRFLLLNGPNLNLLGQRETSLYGVDTLSNIEQKVKNAVQHGGASVDCFQSNAEHKLIDKIHKAKNDGVDYILFNPAAYTHTSIALRDALLAVAIPFTEIHITDPLQREAFRHVSYFSDIANEVVKGLGIDGYEVAAKQAITWLEQQHLE